MGERGPGSVPAPASVAPGPRTGATQPGPSEQSTHEHLLRPNRPLLPSRPVWARGTGWHGAVDEGLRLLGMVSVVLLFVLTIIPMAAQPISHHGLVGLGFALLECYLAACTLVLLVRRHSPAVVVVLTLLLVSALGLMSPHRDSFHPGDIWSPGMWAVPLQVLALQSLPRRAYRRFALLGLALLAAVEVEGSMFWTLTASRLCDSLIILEPLITLHLFGEGLLNRAQIHDESAAKAQEARASQLAQTTESEGRREAARVLHDHVLHALHAVAEDRSFASAQEAVEECRATLDRIDGPPASARLTSLTELVLADPTLERLGTQLLGDAEPLPAPVATAMAAATHEVLVNVERHAQARRSRIEVLSAEGGCRVRIIDDGRGFDPTRRPQGRLGLQRSVHERMRDIGGRATVSSRIGAGTTVELLWPVSDDEPAPLATETVGARRMLTLAALPGLVTSFLVMALMAPHTHGGDIAIALTTGMLTFGLWEVAANNERPIGQLRAAALLGTATLAWVADLVAAPTHAPNVYHLYAAWGAAAVVQIVVAQRTRRVGELLCLGLVAALLLGTLAKYPPSAVWNLQNGAIAAALVVYIGFRGMWLAQDVVEVAEANHQQVQRTHLDVARMHSLARLDQFWSDRVTGDALPLIRGIAEGSLDPDDDQVRRLARETESLVRDELVLGPGQRSFSEQLHHLRVDGWVVVSSLSRDDGTAVLEAAGRLVGLLGPAAHPGQALTLSATGGSVSAVVLDAPDHQTAQWHRKITPLGGTMHSDPDFVRLTLAAR